MITILENLWDYIIEFYNIKSRNSYLLINEVYTCGTLQLEHVWSLNIGHLG